jgi:excisionase family DNA binding protein
MDVNLRAAAATLRRIPIDVATTDELALHLKCHRRTVERLVHRGVLHPIRVGRSWRFDRDQAFEDLDAMK